MIVPPLLYAIGLITAIPISIASWTVWRSSYGDRRRNEIPGRSRDRRRRSRGFTLGELLVAIILLGVLVAYGLHHLTTIYVRSQQAAGLSAAARNLFNSSLNYYVKNDSYPASLETLVNEGWIPKDWGPPGLSASLSRDLSTPFGRLKVTITPIRDLKIVNAASANLGIKIFFEPQKSEAYFYVYPPASSFQEVTPSSYKKVVTDVIISSTFDPVTVSGGATAFKAPSPWSSSNTVRLPINLSGETTISFRDPQLRVMRAAIVKGSVLHKDFWETQIQQTGQSGSVSFQTGIQARLVDSTGSVKLEPPPLVGNTTRTISSLTSGDYLSSTPDNPIGGLDNVAIPVSSSSIPVTGLSGEFVLEITITGSFDPPVDDLRYYSPLLRRAAYFREIEVF